jgi:hypothetical protein
MEQLGPRTVLGHGHPFESILKSFRVYLHRFCHNWQGKNAYLSLSLVFDRYVRSEYFEDNPSRSIAIGCSSTGPVSPGFFFKMRAAIMFNPDGVGVWSYMNSVETAARSLKVVPIIAPVHSDVEIETAIIALGREPGGGLVVMPAGQASIMWRQPETTYRRSMRYLTLSETAVCSPTDPTR